MKPYLTSIVLVIRKHYIAVALSILIGVITVGPQIWFIHSLGNNYRGIYITKTDAELHYLARMQESIDGGGMGNPFVYEYKNNAPSTFYDTSETILAWPARILGISIPNINLVYKFLLPTIIALLAYALTYRLIGNQLWSATAMFVLTLGPTLLSFGDIVHLLRGERVYTQFLLYSRPVNPELSSILFFAYLHILLSALREKTKEWFVFLGALFGLSFYVYLYSYTFLFALNGIVFCISAAKREWNVAKGMLLATVAGLVIGLPAIINTILLYTHPYYKEMAALSDIVASHRPIVSAVGVLVAIIFIWFARKQKDYPDMPFLGALLVTSFVVINQQVLTGIIVQEGHYHWYFNIPIFILILTVVGYNLIAKRYHALGMFIAISVCAAAFSSALLVQVSSYQHWAPSTTMAQRFAPVLAWLKEKTPKESVIMANQDLSELIPVYTSDNVVWESHAAFYLLSPERRNFTPDNILKSAELEEGLLPYRLDYFVWDTVKNPEWKLDKYPLLNKLYDDGEFKIYGR